ncbi:MAG: FAD-dependent oxidoreductase [Deltaproteobacteria bacterium]|nr:FAD-dependent oxidoreductase [Deltaproteobacteria bacterium]
MMGTSSARKTMTEPAREIEICREADVVVVGGGPGGIGSALSAARSGANTVLVERYGHLGGMATGGLVTIIPNLSDISGEQQITGICQELIDRLDARGATDYPKKKDWGSTDEKLVQHYLDANLAWFYIRDDLNIGQKRVLYTALIDPEIMKCELNNMMEEAGVKLYLHSWGARPIVEGNTVKGVIIENKSGRQAIPAKVVIDSTGDGDLLRPAGAECDTRMVPGLRIAAFAFPFWIGNVNMKKLEGFRASQPKKYDELMQDLRIQGGAAFYLKDLVKFHDGIVWFHPFFPSMNQSDIHEINRVELEGRKKMLLSYDFYRNHVPGFENSYIALSSPQLGTQGGQRVIGEYVCTAKDMTSDEVFEDTIAIFPDNDNGEISAKHPNVCIPYRALVPKKIDGLLVACRAFSSEYQFNEWFNLIPHCIAFGQAAGTAAYLAVEAGIQPRKVNYSALQKHLIRQGVKLPVP